MKFGILGYGYVGKATHKGLLRDARTVVHDITFDTEKIILKECDCFVMQELLCMT